MKHETNEESENIVDILPLLFSVTFGRSRAARKLAGDDSLGELKLELALLQPSSIMEMEAAQEQGSNNLTLLMWPGC